MIADPSHSIIYLLLLLLLLLFFFLGGRGGGRDASNWNLIFFGTQT
jgi:hypothetical protein